MSSKKRKHNPDVQGTLWPVDEFDKPDVDHMTPIDEGVFDDIEGLVDVKNFGCSRAQMMYCPENCKDCEYFEG